MFDTLHRLPDDPILSVMTRFRADPDPRKVDLGVGVYRTVGGETPVLDCVRRAEAQVLAAQTSKSYVAPAGRPEFNSALTELVLGSPHDAVQSGRVVTVQAPGGCGALRLGAELIRAAVPGATVYVSDPTWGNHIPLLGSSGLPLARYPYYDTRTHTLQFDAMLGALDKAAPGNVVLIHACCHNPSGADLDAGQWSLLLGTLQRRRLIPFLDLAYQGFAVDLEADVAGIRQLVAGLPEALIAVSFSKSLGLYRERVGGLICVGATPAAAVAAGSHLLQISRSIYSMPPDHGAAIAAAILADANLKSLWIGELAAMRARITAMRELLAGELVRAGAAGQFDFLRRERGMFSLLGAAPEAVARLRDDYHVYMMGDSRMNLAGLTGQNAPYVAAAIAAVCQGP